MIQILDCFIAVNPKHHAGVSKTIACGFRAIIYILSDQVGIFNKLQLKKIDEITHKRFLGIKNVLCFWRCGIIFCFFRFSFLGS